MAMPDIERQIELLDELRKRYVREGTTPAQLVIFAAATAKLAEYVKAFDPDLPEPLRIKLLEVVSLARDVLESLAQGARH